jgi:hypothetical protein
VWAFGRYLGRSLIVFSALVLCAYSFPARADYEWYAIHFVCIPDLDYFSVQTKAFEDVNPKDAEAAKRLETENGIYAPASVLATPYKCDLPSSSISAEIVGYVAPYYPGACGLSDTHFGILLRINGTEAYRFDANNGNCDPSLRLVEIDRFNRITDCRLSTGYAGTAPPACRSIVSKIKPLDSPQ